LGWDDSRICSKKKNGRTRPRAFISKRFCGMIAFSFIFCGMMNFSSWLSSRYHPRAPPELSPSAPPDLPKAPKEPPRLTLMPRATDCRRIARKWVKNKWFCTRGVAKSQKNITRERLFFTNCVRGAPNQGFLNLVDSHHPSTIPPIRDLKKKNWRLAVF